MLRLYKQLLLIGIGLMCVACQPQTTKTQAYVFGTLVDVQVDDLPKADAIAASNAVFTSFQQLHQRLHAWQPSELSLLNQKIARGEQNIPIAHDLATMLLHAQSLAEQSQGLFNPGLGQLIGLWGFHKDNFSPVKVDFALRDQLLTQHISMNDFSIAHDQLSTHQRNLQFDLGGYAKGYALDIGLNILKQHGVKNALINIGGNVMALGTHQGKPWRVGIQHPRKPSAIAALDLPNGWAIGTSGDYQRFYMLDGKRYCHILDPRTGAPAQGTEAVTVLIPPHKDAGVLSDVASKPIFISDASHQVEAAKNMGVAYFMVIRTNGEIWLSQALSNKLEWLDNDAKQHQHILP